MGAVVPARLLHELLPELRHKHGMSQSDLSSATVRIGDHGISVNTIQSYEKAKNAGRIPEVEILETLAAALGEQPDVFYEWPIAVARRGARPSVSRRAQQAAQRLDGTQSASSRTRRAAGDEAPAA